jgi:type IV pilus assembly protein PilM
VPIDPTAATPADPTVAAEPGAAAPAADGTTSGPTGAAWVIELKGYHYYNSDLQNGGANHVRNTLLKNLQSGAVTLPIDHGRQTYQFTMQELGIQFPILLMDEGKPMPVVVPNPDFDPKTQQVPGAGFGAESMPGFSGGVMPGGPGMSGYGGGLVPGQTGAEGEKKKEDEIPPTFKVSRYSFVVQFCWQPKRISERIKAREEKMKAQAAALTAGEGAGGAAALEAAPPAEAVPAAAPPVVPPAAAPPDAGAGVAPPGAIPPAAEPPGAVVPNAIAPANEAGKAP